jgi:hypothetical protein
MFFTEKFFIFLTTELNHAKSWLVISWTSHGFTPSVQYCVVFATDISRTICTMRTLKLRDSAILHEVEVILTVSTSFHLYQVRN